MLGAVDIGGTKIAVGLVTDSGQLEGSIALPTRPSQSYQAALGEVVDSLAGLAQKKQAVLHGIGIGATGRINPDGSLQTNQFLPNWSAQNPRRDLESYFGVRATIQNDADAAALAEYRWGAGAGAEKMIYVTVSTGIGGGIVLSGELYRGVDGCHPEIGHHVIDPSGPPCFCGANGCWERMASGTALADWTLANGGPPGWDARTICEQAAQGNELARSAVERVARYLGIGLANLVTIFAPDRIVLGGGMSASWELFRPAVEITIQRQCGVVPWQKISLAISQLQHPGLLGAAATWFY